MREFYRRSGSAVGANSDRAQSLIQQVLELTQARWRDHAAGARRRSSSCRRELSTRRRSWAPRARSGTPSPISSSMRPTPCPMAARSPCGPGGRRGRGRRRQPGAPCVSVEVSDTGVGMDAETRPALPRAVLHHQGRARHRNGPRHGLRHGAASSGRSSRSTAPRARAPPSGSLFPAAPGAEEETVQQPAARPAGAAAAHPDRGRRPPHHRIAARDLAGRRPPRHGGRGRTGGHRRVRGGARERRARSSW